MINKIQTGKLTMILLKYLTLRGLLISKLCSIEIKNKWGVNGDIGTGIEDTKGQIHVGQVFACKECRDIRNR